MYRAKPYRQRKVIEISRVVCALSDESDSAWPLVADGDGEKLDPDGYKEKHGRCPSGFQWSREEETCKPGETRKGKKARKEKEGVQKEAKDAEEQERSAKEKRKARQAKLTKLGKENPVAYKQEVARMREAGELPDKKTMKLLVKIKNVDDLPEAARNDPETLKQIIEQQDNQRQIEKLANERLIDSLQDFKRESEQAKKMGRTPPKVSGLKLLHDLTVERGRGFEEKLSPEAEAYLDSDEGMASLLAGIDEVAPEPNSKAYKMKKWLTRISKPLPKLNVNVDWIKKLFVRSEVVMPKKSIRAVLDEVADELEGRKAPKLATFVDVAAKQFSGEQEIYPTADEMPTPAPGKKFDLDFQIKTGDYSGNLGFPPYDKKRPGVKGDEAVASRRVKAAQPYGVLIDWGGGDFKVEEYPNRMQAVREAKRAAKENKDPEATFQAVELDSGGAPSRTLWSSDE